MRKKRKTEIAFSGLTLLLCLSGCVSVSQTYTSDGRLAYAIACGGLAHGMGDCYAKAGELCGTSGYEVLGQGEEHIPISSTQAANGIAITRDGIGAANYYRDDSFVRVNRGLFVTCK